MDEGNNRRCLSIEEMLAKGFLLNEAGFWITKPKDKRAVSAVRSDVGAAID
jgi:hypothetical protein